MAEIFKIMYSAQYFQFIFVIHAFHDKNNPGELIVVEGFVYAPRYDKRDYIRQVESILYSFDWKEDFGK